MQGIPDMRKGLQIIRNSGLLFVLWILLSGRSESWLVILGLLGSIGIAWFHSVQPGRESSAIPALRFMVYLPWLFYRVLISNLHTAFVILHPKMPIDPVMIRYPTRLRNSAAITLLANSITLTPGTVTAETAPGELTVHALDSNSSLDLTSGRLEAKIAWIFEKKGSA
jgi:multicomponent Na+:H+ antiporter subunit E